jgi:hypothetical protein
VAEDQPDLTARLIGDFAAAAPASTSNSGVEAAS